MANRKMNRLDKYAETRIWNLKIRNRNMGTEDLIQEMIFRFNLESKASLFLKLQKIILSARRRVMRRRTAVKKNIRKWSAKLFLPEKTIAPLVWKGMLTEDNINVVFEVLVAYRVLKETERAEMAEV